MSEHRNLRKLTGGPANHRHYFLFWFSEPEGGQPSAHSSTKPHSEVRPRGAECARLPRPGRGAMGCQACRLSKVKCVHSGNGTDCTRCLRLGLTCIWKLSNRGKANARRDVARLGPAVRALLKDPGAESDRGRAQAPPGERALGQIGHECQWMILNRVSSRAGRIALIQHWLLISLFSGSCGLLGSVLKLASELGFQLRNFSMAIDGSILPASLQMPPFILEWLGAPGRMCCAHRQVEGSVEWIANPAFVASVGNEARLREKLEQEHPALVARSDYLTCAAELYLATPIHPDDRVQVVDINAALWSQVRRPPNLALVRPAWPFEPLPLRHRAGTSLRHTVADTRRRRHAERASRLHQTAPRLAQQPRRQLLVCSLPDRVRPRKANRALLSHTHAFWHLHAIAAQGVAAHLQLRTRPHAFQRLPAAVFTPRSGRTVVHKGSRAVMTVFSLTPVPITLNALPTVPGLAVTMPTVSSEPAPVVVATPWYSSSQAFDPLSRPPQQAYARPFATPTEFSLPPLSASGWDGVPVLMTVPAVAENSNFSSSTDRTSSFTDTFRNGMPMGNSSPQQQAQSRKFPLEGVLDGALPLELGLSKGQCSVVQSADGDAFSLPKSDSPHLASVFGDVHRTNGLEGPGE